MSPEPSVFPGMKAVVLSASVRQSLGQDKIVPFHARSPVSSPERSYGTPDFPVNLRILKVQVGMGCVPVADRLTGHFAYVVDFSEFAVAQDG